MMNENSILKSIFKYIKTFKKEERKRKRKRKGRKTTKEAKIDDFRPSLQKLLTIPLSPLPLKSSRNPFIPLFNSNSSQ